MRYTLRWENENLVVARQAAPGGHQTEAEAVDAAERVTESWIATLEAEMHTARRRLVAIRRWRPSTKSSSTR